ncbi:MAG: XRE family transcriptional regulator [Candidatus Binatia bacterium]|jgi:Zn-dependent peptidase ImmA (M78 family)/transcriptional regulator with XRE-family HTH domain
MVDTPSNPNLLRGPAPKTRHGLTEMPPGTPVLFVKPELMRWARATAGITRDEVIAAFDITDAELSEWESQGARINARNLERLASFYKRSTAVFFMPSAPEEPPALADFRLVPSGATFSTKLLLSLRRARRAQRIYTDLMADVDGAIEVTVPPMTLGDDIETAAARLRGALDVPFETQTQSATPGKALMIWRRAVERLGVLVFQFPMAFSHASGFSLPGAAAPTIVLNGADAPSRRQFTLFHELAHLSLNAPGICDVHAASPILQKARVEAFCNNFAGSLLVPKPDLRTQPATVAYRRREIPLMTALNRLQKVFFVSRDVILRCLNTLGFVPASEYTEVASLLARLHPTGGGKSEPAMRPINQLGGTFVRSVVAAHKRGLITANEVCDYLSTRWKYIEKVDLLAPAA